MRVFSVSSSGGARRYASADEMPVKVLTNTSFRVYGTVNDLSSVSNLTTYWPFSSTIGAVKSSTTVNNWVTVGSVSGLSGLLNGVLTPEGVGGSIDVRLTIDGKVTTINRAFAGHNRLLVGVPFAGVVAYPGYEFMAYNQSVAHTLPGIEFNNSLSVEYRVNGTLSTGTNDTRSLALYTTY